MAPKLPEPRSDPPERFALVTVFVAFDHGLIGIAESLLRSADIPFVSEADDIIDLFGIGRLSGCNPITGPPRLLVALQDADDARSLLADLTASEEAAGCDDETRGRLAHEPDAPR